MAARENQGLQIGLIIFVTLTVLLSLTTFVFFRNYQNEQQRSKGALESEGKARQALTDMNAERDQMMQYIGFQPTEKKEVVDDAWKKDMAAFQALRTGTLPDDQKTYRKMMDGLQGIIRSQHAQSEKQASDLRDAKADFDRKTAEYETQKKTLSQEKDKTVADYLAARETNEKLVKELENSKTELAGLLDKKQKDIDKQKAQYEGEIAEKNKSIAKQESNLHEQLEAIHKLNSEFSVNTQPNGKISWVNQRDNVAYINLGSDDLLHKRVTFTVYDQNTTDPSAIRSEASSAASSAAVATLSDRRRENVDGNRAVNVVVSEAKSKGVLEVINVTGPHLAECRILNDMPSNPILPGDLVYTPLWHSGLQQHFALAGFLDINGDDISDLAKVLDLIRVNGGIVDAFTDEKGNVQGKLTNEARYLVKGKSERREFNSTGYNKLVDEAKELGVEAIDLPKFLDMMGYTPPRAAQTDVSGRTMHIPEAGEPTDNFRARQPRERTKTGSSY
ncbi:MAG TPA: hypothetical protein VGJ04_04150 [Pirellulales bacterium]